MSPLKRPHIGHRQEMIMYRPDDHSPLDSAQHDRVIRNALLFRQSLFHGLIQRDLIGLVLALLLTVMNRAAKAITATIAMANVDAGHRDA